ncbi:MAG: hypothetical protein IKC48_03680 [Clostridia bacterium]|nr:hypothetical protein [Clostridia bacterium]
MKVKSKENTNENTQIKRAKIDVLFNEILEVVTDSFVAIYEIEQNSIIMRFLNGQKFLISVKEVN